MKFNTVMSESVVTGPAYKLAAQGLEEFGNKKPEEIIKRMIEKSTNKHRQERIKRLEKEIKYAIKFMKDDK